MRYPYGIIPGKLSLYSVGTTGTGAGITYAPLQPTAGELWVVMYLTGYHNEVAARELAWNWIDEVANADIGDAISPAANVRVPFPTSYQVPFPLTINRVSYPRLRGTNIDGAHVIQLQAVIYKIRGVGTWSNA